MSPTSHAAGRSSASRALRNLGMVLALALVAGAVRGAPSHAALTGAWQRASTHVRTSLGLAEPQRGAVVRHRIAIERALILDLVRRHRATAGESWRRELAEAVWRESVAAGVDPLIVASIVARESSFQSRVVSPRGAVGLMQIRPWVARDVAERAEIAWRGEEMLYDPALNVRLGILYYKELVDRFEGDVEAALTAYNRGPSRLRTQLRAGGSARSSYASEILDLHAALREEG